ncbi:MAG: hypothetical protein ACYSUM_22360, partial [Planctomycetota bacterium]
MRREAPYVLAGLLFFLSVLLPTIGVIQVGRQAMADRYAYVPLIGIFWIVAWGVPDLLRRWPHAARALPVAGCAVLLALATVTQRYVAKWRDSASIFEHALASTRDNLVVHWLQAGVLMRAEDLDGALEHLDQALRINAAYAPAHHRRGLVLLERSDPDGAVEALARAIRPRSRARGHLPRSGGGARVAARSPARRGGVPARRGGEPRGRARLDAP